MKIITGYFMGISWNMVIIWHLTQFLRLMESYGYCWKGKNLSFYAGYLADWPWWQVAVTIWDVFHQKYLVSW